jgi:hypothetical protein
MALLDGHMADLRLAGGALGAASMVRVEALDHKPARGQDAGRGGLEVMEYTRQGRDGTWYGIRQRWDNQWWGLRYDRSAGSWRPMSDTTYTTKALAVYAMRHMAHHSN